MLCSSQLRSLLILPGEIPLQVNEAVNVYTSSKLVFFSSLDTLCLYIKVFKYKAEKGEHILTKKTQVRWSILFATRKPLCSSHTHPMKCKPHFFSLCTSLVYLSKFRKYFMYGRDETWGFLHVTPWWLGLGWHQRRPAFTSCSAIGFLCKVSLNALHFHMDTTASAGVARWCCNTHSRNRRKCEGGQNCTRMAAVFQQLHGDLSINLWLPQEPKCFDEESRWLTQG